MGGSETGTAQAQTGENDVPDQALIALLYEELKALARDRLARERAGHTLTATALVHEVFLRLESRQNGWPGREYFLLAAAEAMRRVLIDHARKRRAAKRGGGARAVDEAILPELPFIKVDGDVDPLDLNEHLGTLARIDPEGHRIVMLRYFAGLTAEDTASLLGLDRRTITRRWNAARAWLFERMREQQGAGDARA